MTWNKVCELDSNLRCEKVHGTVSALACLTARTPWWKVFLFYFISYFSKLFVEVKFVATGTLQSPVVILCP